MGCVHSRIEAIFIYNALLQSGKKILIIETWTKDIKHSHKKYETNFKNIILKVYSEKNEVFFWWFFNRNMLGNGKEEVD